MIFLTFDRNKFNRSELNLLLIKFIEWDRLPQRKRTINQKWMTLTIRMNITTQLDSTSSQQFTEDLTDFAQLSS